MKPVTEINCSHCLKVQKNYWSEGNGLSVCPVERAKSFLPAFPQMPRAPKRLLAELAPKNKSARTAIALLS